MELMATTMAASTKNSLPCSAAVRLNPGLRPGDSIWYRVFQWVELRRVTGNPYPVVCSRTVPCACQMSRTAPFSGSYHAGRFHRRIRPFTIF